jgi:hypothetical protein
MKKKLTEFRIQIRSRHPSHNILRSSLPKLPFKSVVRLGSTTELDDVVSKGGSRMELNSVQGVKNSANKLLMKQCFTAAEVQTADWYTATAGNFYLQSTFVGIDINALPYPIISKSLYGSRGIGNAKHNTQEDLERWMVGKDLSQYIFEEMVTYSREYRLHITEDGCFYTCRKLLKNDAPADTWQRHDDVSVWCLEENPSFKKPKNWDAIVEDCVKAQKALGLDVCAFDVGVQGNKNGKERENPKWVIYESCSAPSHGNITSIKYIEEIPKLLMKKANR